MERALADLELEEVVVATAAIEPGTTLGRARAGGLVAVQEVVRPARRRPA